MNKNNYEKASIYLDEWKHRDDMLVKYTFSFFMAIIVVSLFPCVEFNSYSLKAYIDPIWFYIVGSILSMISIIVVFIMGDRLYETNVKYRKEMGDYISKKNKVVLSKILPPMMFIMLIVLNLFFVFNV